jgi:two-component system CheB/CheR fusion protein
LAVRDNGIGIAPEMLPRLFELFSQAEPSRHRSHGGLGIGLALARQMIEMHGGRIAAASEGHGRGSTFEVRLPVAADASMAALAASPSQRPDDHARRVLIIDDNVDAAESMAMLVRELGGEADTAHDGRHGIERMRLFRPEVVLLDIGMPGMDGYETCRHLRSLGREAYIVALTGWGQDQDRSRALRSGFDAHLTKPADPCQLEQLLVSGRKF